MNLSTIIIILIVLTSTIAGAYYLVKTHEISTPNTNNNTITSPQTTNKYTTTHNEQYTTTMLNNNGVNDNRWDLAEEFTVIRLTHTPDPNGYPPPVLINGTFYDFTYAKVYYNITLGNRTISFYVEWSMKTEPYTAICHNFMDGTEISRQLSDALAITYKYNFTDGYWFTVTSYLPNETNGLDFFNILPFTDFETLCTPHGAQIKSLGAEIHSSDPNSNGKWTSAETLLPVDEATSCYPIVEGSPEAYSFQNKIGELYNHEDVLIFMPIEFNNPNGILSVLNQTIEETGGTIAYDTYYYKVTPIGTINYPGIQTQTTAYKITFGTQPDYVHGYYIIIPQSIVPLEYHAVFPKGDELLGEKVTITIKLIDATIQPYTKP